MTTPPTPPGRRRAPGPSVLLAAVALAVGLPADAGAQSPERPLRTHRHLAVGNVGLLNTWDPTIQAGYLYQVSFRKSRVEVDEMGISRVSGPRWLAHASAAAGWAADAGADGDAGFAGTGQLGVLYRFDGPATITRAGLAAQGSLGPDGLGPVARLGFFNNNAALSAGWMWFDGRSAGPVVNLELLRCILQDLGLVRTCVVQ